MLGRVPAQGVRPGGLIHRVMMSRGRGKYWSLILLAQFSSVALSIRCPGEGNIRDDPAEILDQSFLREAIVSSSGVGRDVFSLTLLST